MSAGERHDGVIGRGKKSPVLGTTRTAWVMVASLLVAALPFAAQGTQVVADFDKGLPGRVTGASVGPGRTACSGLDLLPRSDRAGSVAVRPPVLAPAGMQDRAVLVLGTAGATAADDAGLAQTRWEMTFEASERGQLALDFDFVTADAPEFGDWFVILLDGQAIACGDTTSMTFGGSAGLEAAGLPAGADREAGWRSLSGDHPVVVEPGPHVLAAAVGDGTDSLGPSWLLIDRVAIVPIALSDPNCIGQPYPPQAVGEIPVPGSSPRLVWTFDDNKFCPAGPGLDCSRSGVNPNPGTGFVDSTDKFFEMYVVADCGTEMHVPLYDVESGCISVLDPDGNTLNIRVKSDCPCPKDPFDPGSVGNPNAFDQTGTEICWMADNCTGGFNNNPGGPGNEATFDVSFAGTPTLCGVYTIRFKSWAGCIWDLFANCDGSATGQFDIYDDKCAAQDSVQPLPELNIDKLETSDAGNCRVHYCATVHNIGCQQSGAVTVRIENGTDADDHVIPPLGPDETTVVCGDLDVPRTGTFVMTTVTAHADYGNMVLECSESQTSSSCKPQVGAHDLAKNQTVACDEPPNCDAGGPYTSHCGTVTLDGAAASDPDGDPVTVHWTSSCNDAVFTPSADVLHPTVTVTNFCDRTCTFTIHVSDGQGGTCSDDVVVTFDDNTPPVVQCPPDKTVECDGSGNTAEKQAWLAQFTATDDCGPLTKNLTLAPASGPMTVDFTDFCDLSTLMLNGSTATIHSCTPSPCDPVMSGGACVLRLTDGVQQAGSALLRQPLSLAGGKSFSTTFAFRITQPSGCTNSNGETGGDGIVFVIATGPDKLGLSGGGIGYEGITPSVGTEFDTWNNGVQDSNNGNHVGVDLDGDVASVQLVQVAPDMNNGSVWHAWVDYNGTSHVMEVRVTTSPTKPPAANLIVPVDLVAQLGQSDAYFGFTSGTGCAANVHDILSWDVSTSGAPSCGGTGSEVATFTATDSCGNSASCVRTFTIVDTTPPAMTAGTIAACYDTRAAAEAAAVAATTATDTCSPPATKTVTSTGTCSATITVTATDACGNKASVIYHTRIDAAAPTLSGVPADTTVQCDAVPAPPTVTATDDCDGTLPVMQAEQRIDGACPQTYTLKRTWTATDTCGHTTSATQTINVIDTNAPTLSGVPNDSTAECSNVPAPATPTATDTCDPAPKITFVETKTPDPPPCPGVYTLTRTWTAKDCAGNSSSKTQTITVMDTKAPTLSGVPNDEAVECDNVPAPAAPTATDACDPNPTITFAEVKSPNPPPCPGVYTLTRTWTAKDCAGNSSSKSQVLPVVDTKAPKLQGVPNDKTVECDNVPAPASPTATDACDPNPAITFAEVKSPNPPPCPGIYTLTRTWTAKDCAGNSSSESQVLTVVDTKAPTLSGVPNDTTVECTNVPAPDSPTATDACDPNPTIAYAEVKSQDPPPCPGVYMLTRTWTAKDCAGNSSSKSQVITVEDTNAPKLQGVPNDKTVECDDVPDPASPTATDACDPNPTISYQQARANGPCEDSYTLTRTWTATDCAANSASESQVITVVDTTAPKLHDVPNERTVECSNIPDPASPTATDNCDPGPAIAYQQLRADGPCEDTYTLTRTWTATDRCGNSSSESQVIHVQDTTAPKLQGVPNDKTVECDEVPDPASPTATDNCDPGPAIAYQQARTDGPCEDTYTLTRTWTATDRCGNSSSESQVIEVQDTTPPKLHGVPNDKTVECDSVPAPAEPTATDNCDPGPGISYQQVRTDGRCEDTYTLTRTWTATDRCGNSSSESQVIQVQDTTSPKLHGVPNDETVECDSVPAPAEPTATDNCDPAPRITYGQVRVDGRCEDSYTLERTWTATDRCGNSSSKTQVITVQDTTPPSPVAILQPQRPLAPTSAGSAAPPRSAAPPAAPKSACSSPSTGRFKVTCAGTDNCDPNPVLSALLRVTQHDVPVKDGDCVLRVDDIGVACGEIVEIRLVAPPCPAKPPKSPRAPVSVDSAGVKIITGESVVLQVTATDRCGNTATAEFDPAREPAPDCEERLADGTCCPALSAPPSPKDCKAPCGAPPPTSR